MTYLRYGKGRARHLAVAAITAFLAFQAGSGPALSQSQDRFRGAVEPVQAKKPYKIAFSSVHFVDKFWMAMTYGMQDEAKQSGATLSSALSAGGYGNLSQQIADLETLAAQRPDGIIVAGATYDGLARTIKRISDSGIKVVVAGTPVNSKDVAVGVLEDEYFVGQQMARYICAKAPKAKVITLPGPQGSEWNKIRFDGYMAAAKECGIESVGNTFQGQMSLDDGQRQASDLLIKHPDAKYVWAVAGLLGDGAAASIKRQGLKVKVVTSAFTELTKPMMQEGYIEASISEPSILTGRLAVQYMIRLLNGDPIPGTKQDALPYPMVVVPTVPVEGKDIASYDLTKYDWAPENWKNPFSQ